MSSPQRSAMPNLYDGRCSEDESCSDGYLEEHEYLSSDDAETDTNSTSDHHREPGFAALEDAGDHMPDDPAGPEDDARTCHRPRHPVRESKKAGATAWTDDMHRLYLDFIEEAFVRSLYEGAACCCYGDFHCYTPAPGRRPAEDVQCVCSGESDEEVESNIREPKRRIGLPVSDTQGRHSHRIDYEEDQVVPSVGEGGIAAQMAC